MELHTLVRWVGHLGGGGAVRVEVLGSYIESDKIFLVCYKNEKRCPILRKSIKEEYPYIIGGKCAII